LSRLVNNKIYKAPTMVLGAAGMQGMPVVVGDGAPVFAGVVQWFQA